ncbi:hypothetical protein ACP4OV_011997 [Aristida adscensionis]
MAPPPTPPAAASNPTPGNSGGSGKKKKKHGAGSGGSSNGGGGGGGGKKVTPVQVAFLVERYLADNAFHAALAAFRADAAPLLAPHRHKPPPRGLLPLADILHDYIALKEARLAVDSAMQAMHALVSTYHASAAACPPPTPPLPSAAGGSQPASPPLVPPLFVAAHSASSPPAPPPPPALAPPQGSAGYPSPMVHHYAHTSTAVVVHNSSDMTTPAPSLPSKKRKATKSAGKTSSSSKKSCAALATSSQAKGKAAATQLSVDCQEVQNMGSAAQPSSAEHSVMGKFPIQTSSVAKSLFRPPQPQLHATPCTPQQGHPVDGEAVAYETERLPSVVANAHSQAQQDIASSQCSIVSSSKTLIVSPLKGGAYYAVERSYHVSSPLKSTHKSSKREHVKGKLNFDCTDERPGSSEQIPVTASTSSYGDKQDAEIDFTNLDIFNADFSFSELLLDLDLDNELVHCQNPSTDAEVERLEHVAKSDYVASVPALPDSVKPMTADPTENINSQAATSVTSFRSITKRVKIVSPVKGGRAS